MYEVMVYLNAMKLPAGRHQYSLQRHSETSGHSLCQDNLFSVCRENYGAPVSLLPTDCDNA